MDTKYFQLFAKNTINVIKRFRLLCVIQHRHFLNFLRIILHKLK